MGLEFREIKSQRCNINTTPDLEKREINLNHQQIITSDSTSLQKCKE